MFYVAVTPYIRCNISSNVGEVYHISDLKEFFYDAFVVDPSDVACRGHVKFFVESILEHRNILARTTAEFLVK